MPKNVEIKARARDWDAQLQRAEALASSREQIRQDDTFVQCGRGYLKVREFGDGKGELIFYQRPKEKDPKVSEYQIWPIEEPGMLLAILAAGLGRTRTVGKDRTVLHCGRTRIHFDNVDNLGQFIELEVVLEPGQPEQEGIKIANDLMSKLGIQPEDLIEGAYVDMLT